MKSVAALLWVAVAAVLLTNWTAHGEVTLESLLKEIHLTQARDYGQLQFSVNGQPMAAKFDGFAEKVRPDAALDLGIPETKNGFYTRRIEVIGSNPNSTGARYFFGLDCIELAKP